MNIAGLDFFGDRGPLVIGADGFTGWDEGVAMRQENVSRPGAHGSFSLPAYQDARVVSVSGNVVANSPADLAQWKNRLTGLLAGGQEGRIQVTRSWGAQWANCRLGAQTRFSERGGTSTATFQIQLWCPDPRKYGNENKFGVTNAVANAFHRGNYDAMALVRVTGAAPNGYRITGPGGLQYRVERAVTSGFPHQIDFNTGVLLVDGIPMSNRGSADVWPVPPGQTVPFDCNVINGGYIDATVTVTDTYI